MENVTVLGSGVLGLQIAFQTAFNDFNVVIYNRRESSLDAAKIRMEDLATKYQKEMKSSRRLIQRAKNKISYESNLEKAVEKADLVIEALPENMDVKKEVYQMMSDLLPEKTILVTNTSTFLPSSLVEFTGRPEKFLALHFANEIWLHNTAEVMGTDFTSQETYQAVVVFSEDIGMVPIELKKEQPAYILNSLLVPLLGAASSLFMRGVADFETIDKTWKIATKAPKGPFEIYDIIGLNTAYNIALLGNPNFAEYIKTQFLDKGKTSFYEK